MTAKKAAAKKAPVDIPVDPPAIPVDEPTREAVVAARLDALTDQILTYAEDTMKRGSPKVKNDFIRGVYPTLMKSLSDDATDGELEGIKEMQQQLFAKLGIDVPELPAVPHPVAPEDFPRLA